MRSHREPTARGEQEEDGGNRFVWKEGIEKGDGG